MTHAEDSSPPTAPHPAASTTAAGRGRRRTGLVLLAVGALLLVFGVVLGTYIAPRLVVVPQNEYTISRAEAADGSFLKISANPKEIRHARLISVKTVRGNVGRSNDNAAVWDSFTATTSGDGSPISYVKSRLALDPRSGRLINHPGTYLGSYHGRFSGYVYKFPFHARKTSYPFFDDVLDRAAPMHYAGTATIGGLTTYKYTQTIRATPFTTMTVPGKFIDRPKKASVHAKRYYTNTRTYWVEPTSGIFVKEVEHHVESFRNAKGQDSTILFDGIMRSTPSTQKHAIANAEKTRAQIRLLDTAPWVLGGLGVAALACGAVLYLPRGRVTAGGYVDG